MYKNNGWRQRWRWLSVPVTLLALAWTAWLLWDALPALKNSLFQSKMGWLVLVVLGSTLSAYFIFEAFYLLFEQVKSKVYNKKELASLFFTGQLIKHLPGRVWSIAYQAAMGDRASTTEWIAVHSVFTVLSILFALWGSCVVLAFTFSWKFSVLLFILGCLTYGYLWQNFIFILLLRISSKVSIRAIKNLGLALQSFNNIPSLVKLHVFVFFLTGWVVYLLSWIGYGLALPNITPVDGVWLCAFYTLAWFIGYISLITPSGMGIRELVFVALAKDFPPEVIASIAVFGRVILIFVDVFLGLIFFRRQNIE